MTQTEALKLALECAERCESIDGMYSWADTITAIKEALAQPAVPQGHKQSTTCGEPVALMIYRGELCYKSQEDDQSFGMWCPVTQDLPFQEGAKFYTTPPYVPTERQRTWEGLSVFEINNLVENTEYEDYRDLVERTEAKLKAKNERKEKNT